MTPRIGLLALAATAAVLISWTAGPAAPARPAPPTDEAPWIEFDGKPQQNPKNVCPGEVVATGTLKPPEGYKVMGVNLYLQPTTRASGYDVFRAEVGTGVSPATWRVTVKGDRVTEGEHWAHAIVLVTRPDGQTMEYETLDRRRFMVRQPFKP